MAVTQNPLIGKAKGKMANAVFTTWKGQNVLKSKALNPYNPNTPAQQAQRNAFRYVTNAIKFMAVFYLLAFKKLAIKSSEYNIAVKKILTWYDYVTFGISQTLAVANPLVVPQKLLGLEIFSIAPGVENTTVTVLTDSRFEYDPIEASLIGIIFNEVTKQFEVGTSQPVPIHSAASFAFECPIVKAGAGSAIFSYILYIPSLNQIVLADTVLIS